MTLILKRNEQARFMRFALVGAIGAVIDFGVFNLITHFTGINAVIASVISFICAVCSNFIWNRYWTYPDSRTKHITHQLLQFIIISVIGLTIRTPLFAFLEKVFSKYFITSSISSPIYSYLFRS